MFDSNAFMWVSDTYEPSSCHRLGQSGHCGILAFGKDTHRITAGEDGPQALLVVNHQHRAGVSTAAEAKASKAAVHYQDQPNGMRMCHMCSFTLAVAAA